MCLKSHFHEISLLKNMSDGHLYKSFISNFSVAICFAFNFSLLYLSANEMIYEECASLSRCNTFLHLVLIRNNKCAPLWMAMFEEI